MDIKKESYFLDFCLENERDTKILVKNVKMETSDSDIISELEHSTCCSQHHLMGSNETIKKSEIGTKIDIKEEHWWLKEASYVHIDIKDETHEDFYPTKPPSIYKEGASSYTSDLFSTGDSEHDVSFNMNMDSLECGSDRKSEAQESVVTNISSIETSVCSETSDNGKVVSKPSCLKPSKLVQQNNKNKQDINKNCKTSHEYRKSYKCDKCNKAFSQLSGLRRHKLSHQGIKPHKCNVCEKAFTRLSSLKAHTLSHQGIKPHKCKICDRSFTWLSNLQTHKLNHQTIKPHKCNVCNKAFTQLSGLTRHILGHQGIKPHQCNICNKAFTDLSHLKRHKLIHDGIKAHKCNYCNKSFTQLSGLKEHKLIHEGIKPHKCNICKKAFTQLAHLKRHKLIHQDTVV